MKTVLFLILFAFLESLEATDKIFTPLREVTPNSYPWVGWIRIGTKRVKCGVTLISTTTAVTAASCVQNIPIDAVIFGDHVRSDTDGNEQEFSVLSITINPGYNSTSFENDFATITLDREAVLNQYVQTIPILPADSLTSRVVTKRCRVMGWGYEVDGASDRVADQSDVLNEITVVLNTTCAAPMSSSCYFPFRDPAAVPCEGDVGGGYFCKRKQIWHLCGVMTGWNTGEGCQAGQRAFYPLVV